MKATHIVFTLCVIAAALCLSAGFALLGAWVAALPIALAAVLWLATQALGKPANANLALWALFTLAAGFGLLLRAAPLLLLTSAVAALCAWDVGAFAQRIRAASHVERLGEMERRHLLRLALTAVLGFALGGAAMLLRVNLGFGVAAVLVILTVLALSQAAKLMAKG